MLMQIQTTATDELRKVFDFGDDCGIYQFPNGAAFIGNEDGGEVFHLSNVVRGDNAITNLKEKWAA